MPQHAHRHQMERGTNLSLPDECLFENIVTEKHATESTVPVSHVQLACNLQYCAFPLNGNELCIWNLIAPGCQPLHLKGHHQQISAVTFGRGHNPLLVCSASSDYIILWNLNECRENEKRGLLTRGSIIGALLGVVLYLRFSPDDKTVAVCAERKVYLLSTEHEAVLAELEGHFGTVTAIEFLSWQTNILVSISEDRTFKVWDHCTESSLYQSSVLSASPLLSIYIDEDNKQLVTGSADGQFWVFSLDQDHQYRCVTRIDLQKEKQQFINKLLVRQQGQPGENLKLPCKFSSMCDVDLENCTDTSLPIFKIEPMVSSINEDLPRVAKAARRVWLGSSTGLFLINLANYELEAVFRYGDFSNLSIQVVGSCAISCISINKVFCLLTSMFGNHISLLEINAGTLMRAQQTGIPRVDMDLSVIARSPPLPTSPVCFINVKKEDNTSTVQKKIGVKSTVKDQPLVFHTTVKSSGYTAAPRMKMFSPKTSAKKATEQPSVRKSSGRAIKEDYPVDCPAPSKLCGQVTVASKPTTVCCIQYSGDGEQSACGLADKSLLVFNSSLIGTPAVYSGHDGAVTSVGWSHNKNLLVSSSDDRTLRIWSVRSTEPALILGKETFCKPIRCSQFYYMDKFIILSSGAEWQLMKYYIDTGKDEIKRYIQKSTCKPIKTFQVASTVEITSLSAVNDFYSYIVLTAGSNRALQVFDLNVGCNAATIPNAHSRAVHQICQNKGSAFSVQEPDSYNLFLTTAIGDGVKLWDLRSLRCVRRFEGHVNRCYPCGVSVSPCGRFVASGSEDRCAYIYSMQSSTFSHKLSGHTDCVINLAFSPSLPELTTATLDGKLHLFRT